MKRSLFLLLALLVAACGKSQPRVPVDPGADSDGYTAPSIHSIAQNQRLADELNLADQSEFTNARRGLIAKAERVQTRRADGRLIWDSEDFDFLKHKTPASVNPSLWRRAQLNALHGLFEVSDGIYQVRGYDLANLSLIRSEHGWILVDPLTSEESANAALAFAEEHLGTLNIRAVILTHSHIDHFGGIAAVLKRAPEVQIIAPKNFLKEATSENLLAGTAMRRRAEHMFGFRLARSPRAYVDSGLGKAAAIGSSSVARPTTLISQTGQELKLDGTRFIFQYTPNSEAPAELTFYLPEHKAFCGAEIVSQTLHNLYTLRGAKVRDALTWSYYIDEAIELFGDSEVCFNSHHWPVWGRLEVIDFLKKQRDCYRYIHDQTLRLANHGYTAREIAEQLRLPASLQSNFATRGYYGTVNHNSKAVYQYYFGWYSGNPAQLHPHPPTEEAIRYIKALGGPERVLELSHKAYDEGDYRWSATLLNHLVFAHPENPEARALLAASYDQLGYQAESGPWRNIYLSAAKELRFGVDSPPLDPKDVAGLIEQMPISYFLDSMMVRLNGPEAEGIQMTLNFVIPDVGETHVLTLENSVLHHRQATPSKDANVTLTITKRLLLRLITGQAGLRELIFGDELDIDGSRLDLLSFFLLLDKPDYAFAIVTP